MFKIKIPATTANLGSGFDSFGLALNLYNEFTFEKSKEFKFVGFNKKYNNFNNMVYLAYIKIFEIYGVAPIKVKITINQNIPQCGGLGSSATCNIAGVCGALHFLGLAMDKDSIIKFASSLEGHSDNVCPAVLGGLVSCVKGDKLLTFKYNVNDEYNFIIFAPDFSVNTEQARKILPQEILFSDAIFNLSRSSNLAKCLENNDLNNLFEMMKDNIHQSYRLKLINGYEDIINYCNNNKIPWAISGSGASILVVVKDIQMLDGIKIIWKRYDLKVCKEGIVYEG